MTRIYNWIEYQGVGAMTIDIRNLDLVKDLLQAVNDEIKNNPIKYSELNGKLINILNEYEEELDERD